MFKPITFIMLVLCQFFAYTQNVGIGTAAPTAKLEILGVGNTNTTAALLAKNSSQTPLFYVRNDGKVGVGLTNLDTYYPWAKVVVASQYGAESDFVLRVADSVSFGSTPWLVLQASGGTLSAPTLINTTQSIGALVGQGFDGTAYQTGGSIYFGLDGTPAANDMPGFIAFNTTEDGTIANIERMRITNTGNVGLGTSTPDASAQLQVLAANKGLLIPNVSLSATNVAAPIAAPATSLLVYNTSTVADVTPGYYYWSGAAWQRFDTGNNTGDWKLDGNTNGSLRTIGTNDNLDLPFETNGTERMRILANGNVGIGTTTPSSRLHIIVPNDKNDNPADNGLYVYNAGNAGDNDDAILSARVAGANAGDPFVSFDVNGVTGWSIGLDNSDFDKLKFANSWNNPGINTAMTIQTNGNVGIGTVSPVFKLQIQQDMTMDGDVTAAQMAISGATTNGKRMIFGYDTNGNGFGFIKSGNLGVTWTPLVLQPNGGNVGIGTTAPATRLHVLGNTGNVMNLESSATESDINYIVPTGNWEVGTNASGNGTSGNQFFVYDNAYRLTVQRGSGNVGIGTTAPSQRMQVSGGQLYVPGFANQNWGNTGTFIENFIGTGDLSWLNGTYSYCIRADYGTIGDWFACYSDQRIKKEIRPLENKEALNVLNQIELKHYKYIDYTNHGTKERIGVIAQQVETVFPEAISTLKNFIPNVYQLAKSVTLNDDNKSITIETEASCECKVGDKIRIFVDKDREPRELDVIAASGNSFTLANWQMSREEESPRQVFVFGKEVADFRGVEYDRIFLLGMAAIQELDHKTAEISTKITELEKLKADVEAMKADLLLLKSK